MVRAGKIGGLYGAGGEVSLTLYDGFLIAIDMEEPVFVEIDGQWVPLFFESFKRRGQRGATVRFADIDTEAHAGELVGLEIFLSSDGLGYAEQDLNDDFIGWTAVLDEDVAGKVIGFVDGVNPLFEVEIAGRTEYIPAVEEFIVEVDENRRRIIFSLPDGLINLNN